jgi:hypothetical protein
MGTIPGCPCTAPTEPSARWVRQHAEILHAAAAGQAGRALSLLCEHLAEFGCDPDAVAAVARLDLDPAQCVLPGRCATCLTAIITANTVVISTTTVVADPPTLPAEHSRDHTNDT